MSRTGMTKKGTGMTREGAGMTRGGIGMTKKGGYWDDKRGYWDDKKRRLLGWQERSSRMTPHHVIPALDAGIQPFHNHQNVVF
ncbi:MULTISPECIES: hypothetical protein [unclassified Wolbachia]|uniref:hypothetical protein n=1 Tax=unclassified Wolbachia TaxID=2640676 RepID=UPI0022267FEB|nr:hypothetical protein [Wolbachia endosymbiont (group A) of Sphaerophoria taeniata]